MKLQVISIFTILLILGFTPIAHALSSHEFSSQANSENIEYNTHSMSMNFFNDKTSITSTSEQENTIQKFQEIEYAQLQSNQLQSPIAGFITANTGSGWSLVIGVLIIGLVIYTASHKFK